MRQKLQILIRSIASRRLAARQSSARLRSWIASAQALLATTILAVGGCAASQCDPNQAGFLTGIGCAVGPGYADRTQQDQAELGAAREQLQSAQGQAVAANAQAAAAIDQRAAMRAQLHALDTRQRDLAHRIALARQHQGVDQVKLQQVQTQLDQLERDRAALGTQPDPAQVQQQQQKLDQLYNIVKQM